MPVYSYSYRDAAGAIQKGTAEAENEESLRTRYQEQGLEVIEVSMLKKTGARGAKVRTFGRVKRTVLAVFCRQFSTMVDAGVSLVRCLDVLGRQTQDPKLKKILVDVGERVESGESLSVAMRRHPKAFDNLFIGLIRAGEVGGVLEESLQRLSQFIEKDVELRRKVKSALVYPIIVVVFATAIVVFLLMFFIPMMAELFNDLGLQNQDMPAITQFLIDFSNALKERWWMFIIGIVVFIISWKLFTSTRFGRRVADRIKMKVPVFGQLHHKVCLARFSRTMGTLLSSGVPILQAMETVAGTVGNSVMADAVLDARARIREGDSIGGPLEDSRLFPPMVVHMIGVGEESGSLDFMLQKIADFYESEVDAMLAALTSILEPLMIIVLGVIVLFIILAMFMPLASLIERLAAGELN